MVSTSSKMKRLSLNDRSGTTVSSSMLSKAGPAGRSRWSGCRSRSALRRRPNGGRRLAVFGGDDAVVGEALRDAARRRGCLIWRSCAAPCDDDQRARRPPPRRAGPTCGYHAHRTAHLQPCAEESLMARTPRSANRLRGVASTLAGQARTVLRTPGRVIEAGQENRSQAQGETSRYSSRIRRLRSLLRNSGEIPRYPATW